MHKTPRVILTSILFSLFAVGCATVEKNSNEPQGAFAIAEEFDKGERYEEAIHRYSDVKNKFPYSNFATRAELAIADVYYKQESFVESQVAYNSFKEMHPNAAQADYVQFRIGMSYFNQLPSTIDRDLTVANDAILNLSELIKKFPNSTYVSEAKEKRSAAIRMLAEKEEYIADFYFKRKILSSAMSRYEAIYNNYRGLGFDSKALSRAAICAKRLGDESKAKKYESILAQDFPGSKEFKQAEKELE